MTATTRVRWSWLSLWTAALIGLPMAGASAAESPRADVVVYGGTAGGAIAAVAAAREGKSVVLVEPGSHIGGMVSGGLGATDTGNRGAIGGYSREFFDRIRTYYTRKYGADSKQVKDCSDGFHFEPHVAEATFRTMLDEARVRVVLEHPLESVRKDGARIRSIRAGDDELAGAVFIDASYEGDLLAQAGVNSTIGREGRSQYGESLAGVQAHSPAHQWSVRVSPYDADKHLLPCVQPGPAGEPGAGDRKVQAYNYRVCMTRVPENRVPFPRPRHYDPKRYELLARYLEAKPGLTVGQLMNPVMMPNGKTDTNNNGAFSTDHIGASWDYPEADAATRARIIQDHIDYDQGFLYFLANDPSVPAKLHEEMNTWGLAGDEFLDTDHWPNQLYVREARRMLGVYVMTQADIMEDRTKADSVGLGSYNTDSHHAQRVPTEDGGVVNEGDFQVHVEPYAIPYRSLVPKPSECENLLVPVCLSASHVAYGTIRMEPVYMILGQACGVASALAVDRGAAVQDVPASELVPKLKCQKAILDPSEVPGGHPSGRLDPARLLGVVVDDDRATATGEWAHSGAIGPYLGSGYRHDADSDKGAKRLRFTPRLPAAGRYEVRLYATPNANRATNVPVVVHSRDGETTVMVDERAPRKDDEPIRVGVFAFDAGESGWVEVHNDQTNGHVVVDAVQFVPDPEAR